MTRAEYFKKQKELSKTAAQAEAESIRRIRDVTRKLVIPLAKQYAEQGMITYPKEELARQIDHIIREEGAKPVMAARKLQEEMEESLAEKLGILIKQRKQLKNSKKKNDGTPRRPIGETVVVPGRGWGYGVSSKGMASYYRDPQTGKIVWTDLPLEYQFRKRADLSTRVWEAVEEQEQMVFDVIQGGRAAGRNVKNIAGDLEQFINYPNGGEKVVGRWMGMFPNTEDGRREAWKREYLAAHGGLQPGSDAAKALLKQPDARDWVSQKMAETTKRGTPRLPKAVKQYAVRLGKAGLDYRAIRIARTETTAMLADEQTAIAENSDISNGEMDFVMERGRDHWNCNCEHYAEQNPWQVDDPDRPEIPVHPNCMCEWRPRLKTDEEILKAFEEEMTEDLGVIEDTQEQADMFEDIDSQLETDEFGFVSGAADGLGFQIKIFEQNDLDTIVHGFSKKIPAIEALGVTKSSPATINESLNVVNPLFDPEREIADRNCVNSVIAHEAQRNGYRVQALPDRNDTDDAYINNAFSAFKLKEGDIERASGGKTDLLSRLNSNQFPDGSRFIISQKWYKTSNNEPGHDYIAEKINGEIRFIDGQKHLDDASSFLDRVKKDKKGNYILHFARIDDKSFSDTLDFSRIVKPSDVKFDNSFKKGILYNKGKSMQKEEALELLKNSDLMLPEDSNGDPVYRHIGEYTETEDTHNWIVYLCSPEEQDDRTYCFMYHINKKTKEVSRASAPLTEDELKYIRTLAEGFDGIRPKVTV